MSVKLELYRVFKEVAEAGNITAAAQTLFISQSAVSQSIKQLEAELQTRLFARNSRGVTLTADGRMLYEYVRSAMGLLETGEEKLSQSRDLQMGHLTIGASDTVTSQFLLPYLDRFHRQYPAIHIQIISGRSHKVLGLLQSGKVDIALLPANVASVLYHKTEGKVSVIDINTLGVLYLVSGDSSISSIENLSGKTVYLPGKGTTPEYVLRYLISASGLSDDAVTLEFKSEASEVAAVLAEDPNAIGLLPQPFVTAAIAQNDSLSVVLDLTKVWDSLQEDGSNSRLVTGVSIVNNEFLAAHKDLVDTFLTEHEASIAYTAADPEGAAALIEKAGIVAKAAIAQKALPACNITYLDGQDMKDALNGYLSVLLSQNPQSVGGSLPEDDFYYLR